MIIKSFTEKRNDLRTEMVEHIKNEIINANVHIKDYRGFRISDEGAQAYLSCCDCECYALFIDKDDCLKYTNIYDDTELRYPNNIEDMDMDSLTDISDSIEELITNRDDCELYDAD